MIAMPNFISNLSIPFKAIVSRRFYIEVMYKWRGAGISYLFMLSAVLAILACFPVMQTLKDLKNSGLSNLVAQIPASYVDHNGVLHPKHPTGKPVELRNADGQLLVLYNPYDAKEPSNERPIIYIASHSLTFQSGTEIVNLPWTAVYGSDGGDFEPLQVSQVLEESFNAGVVSCWIVVLIWFFSSLACIVLLAGLVGKIAAILVFKVHIPFLLALRLAAVGSTLAAFLMLSEFFIHILMPYLLLSIIPIGYIIAFAQDIRRLIERSNSDPEFAVSEANPLREWFIRKQTMGGMQQDPSATYQNIYRNGMQNDQERQDAPSSAQSQAQEQSQNLSQTQDKDQPQEHHQHQRPDERDGEDEKSSENNFALNEKWDDDEPVFDEHHVYHSGEVKRGKNGEDSSFTP